MARARSRASSPAVQDLSASRRRYGAGSLVGGPWSAAAASIARAVTAAAAAVTRVAVAKQEIDAQATAAAAAKVEAATTHEAERFDPNKIGSAWGLLPFPSPPDSWTAANQASGSAQAPGAQNQA